MRYSSTIFTLVSLAIAQRPSNTSICDYYTTALLDQNNAPNQMALLTLLVNTVVIGNYTKPNVGVHVPGILANGTFNGTDVDLLPYFTGGLLSTNRGGSTGMAVNFLDDGGAAPLMLNKPANGTSSAQYKLMTHLYEFFGYLLGCSELGKTGFPAYTGETSMYTVHKFMDLSTAEMGYFITQVGLAAASFGVATDDITAVAMSLQATFGYRCAPAIAVLPESKPELQAMCIADDCPLAPSATCSAYAKAAEPASATGSATAEGGAATSGSASETASASGSGSASGTGTGTGTGSGGASSTSSGASTQSATSVAVAGMDPKLSGTVAAVIAGAALFALGL